MSAQEEGKERPTRLLPRLRPTVPYADVISKMRVKIDTSLRAQGRCVSNGRVEGDEE